MFKVTTPPSLPSKVVPSTPKIIAKDSPKYQQELQSFLHSATIILNNDAYGALKILKYLSTTCRITGNAKLAELLSHTRDNFKEDISLLDRGSAPLKAEVTGIFKAVKVESKQLKSELLSGVSALGRIGGDIVGVFKGTVSKDALCAEVKKDISGSSTVSSKQIVATISTDVKALSSSIAKIDTNSAEYTAYVRKFMTSSTNILNMGGSASEELLSDLSSVADATGNKQLGAFLSHAVDIIKGSIAITDEAVEAANSALPGFVNTMKLAAEEFNSKLEEGEKDIKAFGDIFFGGHDSVAPSETALAGTTTIDHDVDEGHS